MLILLHESNGREFIINVKDILLIREEWNRFSHSGLYELHFTGGGMIRIMESPQRVEEIQRGIIKAFAKFPEEIKG